MRLIITYKLVKGPAVLLLALLLTFSRVDASSAAVWLAHDLSTHGLKRLGSLVLGHVSVRAVQDARLVAWIDGTSTVLEGILLLLGRAWAQWIVIVTLSLALLFELVSFGGRPSALKALVVAIEVAILIYLVREQRRTV